MRNQSRSFACLAAALLVSLAAASGRAAEGKWTPEQMLELDPAWLRSIGLELAPRELWDPAKGTGLAAATANIETCSAGFVSAAGLIVTNHHCAMPIIQQHATVERDLIRNGFLAASRSEELAGKGARALVPHRFTDVTVEMQAAAAAAKDDLGRSRALQRRELELVTACERQLSRRCRVAMYDAGVRWTLIESVEFPDVRLVYAPGEGVGSFGGEVDNWKWPRHSGDFAVLRAYAGPGNAPAAYSLENVPYEPPFHFQVSPTGAAPGSFVMILGFPGTTFRAFTGPEIEERMRFFDRRAEMYRAWLDAIGSHARTDDAARIALASHAATLENREKNARGQLAGLARGRILEKKRAADDDLRRWAAGRKEYAAAARAYDGLAAQAAEKGKTWERDFLLWEIANDPRDPTRLGSGPRALTLALALVRWGAERGKPDAERAAPFTERNLPRLREALAREQKKLHPAVERDLMKDLLARFAALPAAQRSAAADGIGVRTVEAAPHAAAALYAGTRVLDDAERARMMTQSAAELAARRDPLLDFAAALDREIRALEERRERWEGALTRLRPTWRRAAAARLGKPIDPDANSTLRISFGHVKGYSPEDGVSMVPHTRLAGMVAKHTGKEPFDAPAAVVAAAAAAPASRWAEPSLGDVPVNFLADCDTTGGNSGSPVLDGRGRLVGLNFDRVWENVANDFGYNPDIARHISVDIRYMLWMLDAVEGARARPLLQELGVAAN